jgi:hypothetical protein
LRGDDFLKALKAKLVEGDQIANTDRALADHLGLTVAGLANWRSKENITVRQMVGLIERVEKRAVQRAEGTAIRPIVEYCRLERCSSKRDARYEIFSTAGDAALYLQGLKEELTAHRGVYIFYDSRGRALYVGKTAKLTLWQEINNAYNRERSIQNIRRVEHPQRKQAFRKADEQRRQIKPANIQLHDMAAYLSAYRVADGMISEVEAMLIRGFPNDLLNVKVENLTWAGSASK